MKFDENQYQRKHPERAPLNNTPGPKFFLEANPANVQIVTPERLHVLEDISSKVEERLLSANRSRDEISLKLLRPLSDFDVDNKGNLVHHQHDERTPGHPTDPELLSRYIQSNYSKGKIWKDGFRDEFLLVDELRTETLYKWRLKRLTAMRQKIYRGHSIDIINGTDLPIPPPLCEIEHVKRATLNKRRHSMFDRRMPVWVYTRVSSSSASTRRVPTRQGGSRSGRTDTDRPITRDRSEYIAAFDEIDNVLEKLPSIERQPVYRDPDQLRIGLESAGSLRKSLSSPRTPTSIPEKPPTGEGSNRMSNLVVDSRLSVDEKKDLPLKSPRNLRDGLPKKTVKLPTRTVIPEEDVKQKTSGLLMVKSIQTPAAKVIENTQTVPAWSEGISATITSPTTGVQHLQQKTIEQITGVSNKASKFSLFVV